MIVLAASIESAAGQSPRMEFSAAADYRAATPGSTEAARERALALARRDVVKAAALQLQRLPEVQAVPLKPNHLEALLSVVVAAEEESASAGKVSIVAR